MQNTIILAQYLGLLYLVISLATLINPRKVQEMLKSLKNSRSGFLALGIVVFAFGLLITMLHNDWSSFAGIIIGIIGWGAVLESLFYLFLPKRSLTALVTYIDKKDVIIASSIVGIGLGVTLFLVGLGVM